MKKNWFFSIISLFVLAGVLLAFWIGGLILEGSASDNISAQEQVDYVVILGCGLVGDQPNELLQSRIDTAVEFLEKYPDSVAICTGGQGDDEPIPESTAIEKTLLKAGIPKERILKETTSKNTYENFGNAKKLIEKQEKASQEDSDEESDETAKAGPRIAIVTSEFHLYRSKNLAELHGFQDPIKVAAKTPTFKLYPHFFREIAAMVAAWYRY